MSRVQDLNSIFKLSQFNNKMVFWGDAMSPGDVRLVSFPALMLMLKEECGITFSV